LARERKTCAYGCKDGECVKHPYREFPRGFVASAKAVSSSVESGGKLKVEVVWRSDSSGWVYFPLDLVKNGKAYVCGDKEADGRNCENEVVKAKYMYACPQGNCKTEILYEIPRIPAESYEYWVGFWQGYESNKIDGSDAKRWKGSSGPFKINVVSCSGVSFGEGKYVCKDGNVYVSRIKKTLYFDGNGCATRESEDLTLYKDCGEGLRKCEEGYCEDGVCKKRKKMNCNGNGICEAGENYCNSLDCTFSCGECQRISCDYGAPMCVYVSNCCGNGVCEDGEDCNTCAKDCGCALSIDMGSVTCTVDGEDCGEKESISEDDEIITSFILTTESNKGIKNVQVTFWSNNQELGSITVNNPLVTYAFKLGPGRQNVQARAVDKRYGEKDEKVLFSIYITNLEDKDGSEGSIAFENPFKPNKGERTGEGPRAPDNMPVYITGSSLLTVILTVLAWKAKKTILYRASNNDFQGTLTYIPENKIIIPENKLDYAPRIEPKRSTYSWRPDVMGEYYIVTTPEGKELYLEWEDFIKYRVEHYNDYWIDYSEDQLKKSIKLHIKNVVEQIKRENAILEPLGLKNPRFITREEVRSTMEQLMSEYYYAEYINRLKYETALTHSTAININVDVERAEKRYEAYLKMLMNNEEIQSAGRKERENDAITLEDVGEGLKAAMTSKETYVGALESFAMSYVMTPICLSHPVATLTCGAIGTLAIIQTINSLEEKDKYANLMAYLYGANSEQYRQAKKGQIVFTIQLGIDMASGAFGSYLSYNQFMKNNLQPINKAQLIDDLLDRYNKLKEQTKTIEEFSEELLKKVINEMSDEDLRYMRRAIDEGLIWFGEKGRGIDLDIATPEKGFELKTREEGCPVTEAGKLENFFDSMDKKLDALEEVKSKPLENELVIDLRNVKVQITQEELINDLRGRIYIKEGPLWDTTKIFVDDGTTWVITKDLTIKGSGTR